MRPYSRGLAVASLLTVLATGCGRAGDTAGPVTSSATAPSATPSATPSVTPSAAPAPAEFAYQPLWPFTDTAGVRAWQDAYRTGGHQPWHLDAGMTALSFAGSYLGFTGIDRVVGTPTGSGNETWVAVGLALPDGRDSTAAVVHLARWGTGTDAPWEVAGTRDTTLTLDTPRYGSTATSPLTVGGLVSGVDESLRVRVVGPAGPVGETCCLPAGGERTRWSTTLRPAAAHGTLTVVVSTGGHVAEVERFAVTGISAP